MFGIGTYEMLVILALGLMLFSPKELPAVLKGIARFWGSIRRTADEFRDAIMKDETINELKSAYTDTADELRGVELQARRELMKARMEVRRAEARLADAARDTESVLKGEAVAAGGPDEAGDDGPAGEASAPPALVVREAPSPPRTGVG